MSLHMALLPSDDDAGMGPALTLHYSTNGFASWDGLLSKSTEKRCT